MFNFITRPFFKGLAIVLPIVAAVYVFLWVVGDTEALVKQLVLRVLPEDYYVPGLGFVLVLVAIFLLGLLMYPWLTRKLLDTGDAVLRRIPFFSMVYSPVRDLMDFVSGDLNQELDQVVLIEIPNTNISTLGFITRKDLSNLPEGLAKDDHVVVYVQWSSQIGGYCFIVPREAVRPVSMSVEEGMRWALTAGISAPVVDQSQRGEPTETVTKT